MKTYKLTENQFCFLMAKCLTERNENIKEIAKLVETGQNHEELVNYYQKQTDKINSFFDEINIKYKTNY